MPDHAALSAQDVTLHSWFLSATSSEWGQQECTVKRCVSTKALHPGFGIALAVI
jgi:hypothetical protein